ncbi:MAG TPA: GNAT family N-acetyltransferase [Glycomyces sp.]|nr:GNAT family N-acetyltransferase [Glycomyces sp.]
MTPPITATAAIARAEGEGRFEGYSGFRSIADIEAGCRLYWESTSPDDIKEDGMAVIVTDAPERNRYEAHIDGKLAGFTEYRRQNGTIMFTHTLVEKAFEGAGVGSALARSALNEARESGRQVQPVCPFFAGWIERHPEYADLVHEDHPLLGEET